MSAAGRISLRGVRVHNLQGIDLDLPRRELIVLCGLSGSGKSSLALDTLYAEGQRRYIESFSAYARQFLQRLEKPDAERIDGIPPAIALTSKNTSRSSRSTVGTATETNDYLRLLLAKIGRVWCRNCGQEVRRDSPLSAADALAALPPGTRYMISFRMELPEGSDPVETLASLREDGFVRAIIDGRMIDLSDYKESVTKLKLNQEIDIHLRNSPHPSPLPAGEGTFKTVAKPQAAESSPLAPDPWPLTPQPSPLIYVIVDRLTSGSATMERIRDSLETAFSKGDGRSFVYIKNTTDVIQVKNTNPQSPIPNPYPLTPHPSPLSPSPYPLSPFFSIDGQPWRRLGFSTQMTCENCELEYPVPEPRLFSFNSPLGACPECEGFGNTIGIDMDLVVPDPNKSIREGAIAPWNSPAYTHELEELLALADDCKIPVDVPFRELDERAVDLIVHGVPKRKFGGLDGFFAWLQRRKYKMHIRVFLSRWRSYRPCSACGGARLRPESLCTRIGGRNIADITAMKVRDAAEFFRNLVLSDYERRVGRMMLEQVQARLAYLEAVGLGYLTLDRTLRTLSGGETRRVAMTSALGSSLVNMLYVLDEPSIGLHPRDINRLIDAIRRLRDRDNTVVVVEHEESIIRAADRVIEIGPGAGERGGRVVFQGTPAEMEQSETSLTGQYLAGKRGVGSPTSRRTPNHGWIRLAGARGNNLQGITVEFPLGMLCLVTGISGSGKSTLVQDTLYPALCRRMHKDAPKPLPFDDIFGDGQIDEVILVDQSPIGRSPRSNPVTYLKVFDEIRAVFAETVEARTRGFTAGHFSFNVDGGRCNTCHGDGYLQIDMQFLADVYMKCGQCNGTRYRDEILDVTYRGRNIAEVLEMTVREAFTFFRGRARVQARLKRLIDVGLDYVRLGQPANTLSGGEAQRLKLAAYMSGAKRGRSLFILDEPTTGLHFFDIVQLLDCFDALLSVGHSLIVVEHNLQMMKAADHIIDLGPGAADEGGRVVAKGTPEMIANNADSVTGRYLKGVLN
jgi:excinuclease ABC subunit A